MNLLQEIFQNQSATARMLADNELERVKLLAAKQAMRYGSGIVRLLVSLALASIITVLLAIALATYLSVLLNSVVFGYLVTAGIFFLLILIWWMVAKKIISNVILNKALKEIYGDD